MRSIEKRLAELRKRLDALPEAEETPPTTLDVLGRSAVEQDWQRLLVHFLSPYAAHGLDHAFLEHILMALSGRDNLDYSFSRFDVEGVQIAQEVTTDKGVPDVLIWSPKEWFVCCELKVHASEGPDQTSRYVDVDSFSGVGLDKDDIPEGSHHYVYLAPESASEPQANDFTHISWEWVASELEEFLVKSHGSYPARTTAQIDDFLSNIRQELTMTEYRENQQEMAQLYFDYYDDLREVQSAFENEWDEFEDNWGLRLAQKLDEAEIIEIPNLPDDFVAIELNPQSGESSRWIFRQGKSWAGIAKEQWRRRTGNGSVIHSSPDDEEYVHITLFHRLEKNRHRAIRDGVLELTLWHGTGGDDRFYEMVNDRVYDSIEQREYELPQEVSIPGGSGRILSATYNIPITEYDDFFDAYTKALRNAFFALVVENHQLITVIDEAFDKSLKEYYL